MVVYDAAGWRERCDLVHDRVARRGQRRVHADGSHRAGYPRRDHRDEHRDRQFVHHRSDSRQQLGDGNDDCHDVRRLAISKIDTPDPVVAGQNVTYTITVTNSGPGPAASATLSDPLPAGTTFVSLSAPGGWSCTTPPVGGSGAISCTIASLGVGSGVFTLTAAIAPTTTGGTVVTNTATVSSSTTDPNPANNSASATTLVRTATAGCDVDGDGSHEFITGAGAGGGPHVRVFGVAGGVHELTGFFAYDPAFTGGVFVACRDLTGDGIAEFVTGAGPGGGPHVRVLSAAGGVVTELGGFFAYDPAFTGGVSVAAGDVTGDGVGELITGAGPC
jgi:uncharacterized repeat protein (TIGR01451 family)